MAMKVVYTTINGVIVHEQRAGVGRNYRPDTLGNTIALTDATTTTDTMTYWPYGEIRTRTGTNATRFLYVGTLGYSKDGGFGLHYVRARHYQATRGRWTTVDPLWPEESMYGYGSCSPVTYADATGLSTCSDAFWNSLKGRGVKPGDLKKLAQCFKDCAKGNKTPKKFMQCLVGCLAGKGLKDLIPYLITYSCCAIYGDGKNDPCSEGAHHNDLQCCDSKWCSCLYNTAAEKQKFGMIPEHLYAYAQTCECDVTAEAGCGSYTMPGHRK